MKHLMNKKGCSAFQTMHFIALTIERTRKVDKLQDSIHKLTTGMHKTDGLRENDMACPGGC